MGDPASAERPRHAPPRRAKTNRSRMAVATTGYRTLQPAVFEAMSPWSVRQTVGGKSHILIARIPNLCHTEKQRSDLFYH